MLFVSVTLVCNFELINFMPQNKSIKLAVGKENLLFKVFPKLNVGNSVNSASLINSWSIKWGPFKDSVSDMCLAGIVAAS